MQPITPAAGPSTTPTSQRSPCSRFKAKKSGSRRTHRVSLARIGHAAARASKAVLSVGVARRGVTGLMRAKLAPPGQAPVKAAPPVLDSALTTSAEAERVNTVSPVVRHRGLVVACWAAALAFVAPHAVGVERVLETAARVEGSESARVEAEQVSRFGAPYAHYALLVVRGAPLPSRPEGRELIDSVASVVAAVPGVVAIRAYRDARDTLFIGRAAGGTLMLVGLDAALERPDAIVPRLRDATSALAGRLAARFPALTLRWTGETVLNADLRQASATSARAAERRALPMTLMLLVAAFGTLAAAAAPVLSGALVIGLTLGVAGLLSARWPLSILLQSFVSMIGLGLGIDYALLSITRFREALAATGRPAEAATITVRSAGHTILLSGLAVAVGFTPLLVVPLSELRSVAIGGLLATGFAMLVAVTLLPALLAWLGHQLERGRLWLPRPSTGERWRAWGRWVTAHPVAVLLAAGMPLGLLAWQATRLRPGLPRGDNWLPRQLESVVALRDLKEMGRGAVPQTRSEEHTSELQSPYNLVC